MSEKKKFKLKINFFDIAIIVIAIVAAVIFIKMTDTPAAPTAVSETTTVRYTIQVTGVQEGVGALIEEGDAIIDNVKNYGMGNIVSVEVAPAMRQATIYEKGTLVMSEAPGYEDITIVVETAATETDTSITSSGGYAIKTGYSASFSGPGYSTSGYIVHIERS